MGDAPASLAGLRDLASTQRLSRYPLGRGTQKVNKQAAKTAKVAGVLAAMLVVSLTLGCKTAGNVAWPNPISRRNTVLDSNGVDPEPRIGLASYQSVSTDPPGVVTTAGPEISDAQAESPIGEAAESPNSNLTLAPLTLEQLLESVTQSYPEIEVAIGEIEAADGKLVSSWGQFDSTLEAFSVSQPLGFYKNYRNGTGVRQPLWGGGEVYGTYRMGRGKFEPWYGDRATDEGGEFKTGFSMPLLKDRSIDSRRAGVQTAAAGRAEVRADVESRLLQIQRLATQTYWDWVASGKAVLIQERLLKLAQQRVRQINERVAKGDLAEIAKIDNERFIAKRRNDLIKARRSLEKAAIKLSLFFRDADSKPLIAGAEQIPDDMPSAQRIPHDQFESDVTAAISIRPELQAINALRRQACIDLQYANNLILPKLDLKAFAAKDVGALASSTGDKRPFQLELGVLGEVPIQRREGLGKLRTAEAKLVQIDAKTRFVADKIRAEIQDAASAVNAAFEQIEQSQKTVDLAIQSNRLGRQLFDAGDIDLIELNIYENSVADAELQLLDAYFKYFFSLAIYRTATSGQAFAP